MPPRAWHREESRVVIKSSFENVIERLAILIVIGVSSLVANAQTSQAVRQTPAQLQQMVAPIALYPDALVAQILTASAYPIEVVEANRWVGLHSDLQGEQLAAQADHQPWEPSVKALTAFPSVLANMDMNLSWTSALGKAYFNQQQDVLAAVQVMRRRAQSAGNLQTTPQQNVTTQGSTIIVQPVVADTLYLPFYDPWVVYGTPIDVYPGYVYEPWYGPPYVAFGPAIGVGFFGRFNRGPFISRGPVFFHHGFVRHHR